MNTEDAEIVKAVRRGGVPASSALARLLESGESYPGNVSDIEALASEFSSAASSYPVAAVAWTYPETHGIGKYNGENEMVARFVRDAVDGSLF